MYYIKKYIDFLNYTKMTQNKTTHKVGSKFFWKIRPGTFFRFEINIAFWNPSQTDHQLVFHNVPISRIPMGLISNNF